MSAAKKRKTSTTSESCQMTRWEREVSHPTLQKKPYDSNNSTAFQKSRNTVLRDNIPNASPLQGNVVLPKTRAGNMPQSQSKDMFSSTNTNFTSELFTRSVSAGNCRQNMALKLPPIQHNSATQENVYNRKRASHSVSCDGDDNKDDRNVYHCDNKNTTRSVQYDNNVRVRRLSEGPGILTGEIERNPNKGTFQSRHSNREQLAISRFLNENSNQLDNSSVPLVQSFSRRRSQQELPAVDTFVCLRSSDPNVQHTETQLIADQQRMQTRRRSCDVTIRGAVHPPQKPSNIPQAERRRICGIKNVNYRRGFYVMLIINTVLVCLNAVGLPYVYMETQNSNFSEGHALGSFQEQQCISCEDYMEKEVNASTAAIVSGSRWCCLKSKQHLEQFFKKATNAIKTETRKDKENQPPKNAFIHLQSDGLQFNNKVTWAHQNQPRRALELKQNHTGIQVSITGFYFLYSRVHYSVPNTESRDKCKVGHQIMKSNYPKDDVLDSIEQNCNYGEHTSLLESMLHLHANDEVFIHLNNSTYWENTVKGKAKVGMFLFFS